MFTWVRASVVIMARKKTPPELEQTKNVLAQRLKAVRVELFGERGGPELARLLSLPARTWYNYEVGVTVPSEVLLRFIELTSVEPQWLLSGVGDKFRTLRSKGPREPVSIQDAGMVEALLDRASECVVQGQIVINLTWNRNH